MTVWENTQLQSRTDALGRTTQYQYNDEGDIRQVALPGGYSLYYDYNEHGQLTRLTAPGNQVWLWAYDEKGSIVSLTDPLGRQQQFSYSQNHAGPQGSVEEINRPDGVRELMRQNSEKLPESVTDGEGKTTRYEYGAFDLLTAVARPDGERLECRYDKLIRLTEITNAEGEHYRLTYDKAGQLTAETDFTGRTLTYLYDAAGRCICTTFPDGTHLNRQYSVTNQVTHEEVTQGGSDRVLSRTTFTYDTLCRLTEARNDDATVTYEYDDSSRVTAETINGRRTEYRYDPDQDTVSQRTTAGITEHFTHSLMGDLTSWQIATHAPLLIRGITDE
ncbi:hypothetical protein VVA15_18785 [Citrobacter portucalensis]